MVEKHCEVSKESPLIGLTDPSKVTQKPAAVGNGGRSRAVEVGVDPPLPSASQESLFHGRLGTDAEVSSHQIKKNGVDTKLP